MDIGDTIYLIKDGQSKLISNKDDLVRNGYVLLACMIIDDINKEKECEKDVIGFFDYLGNGWEGDSTTKLSPNNSILQFNNSSCHSSIYVP